MKVFILFVHPDIKEKSYNHAILRVTRDILGDQGAEVKISDLYKMRFLDVPSSNDFTNIESTDRLTYMSEQIHNHMIAEIVKEQEKVLWCDYFIIIGPNWWGRLPSPFYSWFSRVVSNPKIYTPGMGYERGLCAGKKAMIVMTTGAPRDAYSQTSSYGCLEARLLQLTVGCLSYIGFTVLRSQFFFAVRDETDATREEWLRKWGVCVSKLEQREQIPFTTITKFYGEQEQNPAIKTAWNQINELGDLTIDEAYEKVQQ